MTQVFEVTDQQNIGGEMGISVETRILCLRDQVGQLKTMPPSIAVETASELCNKIEMIADEIFSRQAALMLQVDAFRQRNSHVKDDSLAAVDQTCFRSELLRKAPILRRIGAQPERAPLAMCRQESGSDSPSH